MSTHSKVYYRGWGGGSGASRFNAGAKPSCRCGQCRVCRRRAYKLYYDRRKRLEHRATILRLRKAALTGQNVIEDMDDDEVRESLRILQKAWN